MVLPLPWPPFDTLLSLCSALSIERRALYRLTDCPDQRPHFNIASARQESSSLWTALIGRLSGALLPGIEPRGRIHKPLLPNFNIAAERQEFLLVVALGTYDCGPRIHKTYCGPIASLLHSLRLRLSYSSLKQRILL